MTNDSLRAVTLPLRTLDPNDAEDSDLKPLQDMIGEARVVCIGESVHDAGEFYDLRHRLARFLIDKMRFDAFVMESGFAEGLLVGEWINGGAGELTDIARCGITWGFGIGRQVQAQLQWLRDWNSTQPRKVSFYGMDVSGYCLSARPAIEACLRRIGRQAGDDDLLALATRTRKLSAAPAEYAALSDADKQRLSSGIERLVERAAGDEPALRCALDARALDEMFKGGFMPKADWNPRDQLMAENVQWILKRHRRIVVAAHNGHIQKQPSCLMDTHLPTLGTFLAPTLGDDLFVIGTTYAHGRAFGVRMEADGQMAHVLSDVEAPPPHTLDALMDSIELPIPMLNLRKTPAALLAGIESMRAANQIMPVDPQRAFDAVIHVRRVTPISETTPEHVR